MDIYELVSLLLDGQETVQSLQTNNNKITLTEYIRLRSSICRLFYFTIFPSINEIIKYGHYINELTFDYNLSKENVRLLKLNIRKIEDKQSIIDKIIYKFSNRDIENKITLQECEMEMMLQKRWISYTVNLPNEELETYLSIMPIEYMIILHINEYQNVETAQRDLLKIINIIYRDKLYLGSLTFRTRTISLIRAIMLTIHYIELVLNSQNILSNVENEIISAHFDEIINNDTGMGVGI